MLKLSQQKEEETIRNYLASEPNYDTTKFLTKNLFAIEQRKTQILMNKPVYLGISILELSKIVVDEFQYDYVKSKHGEKAKFCYMDTDISILYIKTGYLYKDIAEDVEARFNTLNYELYRPLPKGKNKKVIGSMKDELGRIIMKKFAGLRAKAYSYLVDDDSEDKKAKDTKKCVIKRKIKFDNYKNCLEATQLNNTNHLEKNKINIDKIKKDNKE